LGRDVGLDESAGGEVIVSVDHVPVGALDFRWSDANPEAAVVRELIDHVAELAAQELGSGA
jgi:hypothetical protein